MVTKYGALKVILPRLGSPLHIMICVLEDKCHTDLIGTNVMDDWKVGLRKRYVEDG